ncbi:MAG: nicotinate-nucleotide adenylyltransferase [Lachnospiraceae bacterium]|nr:nicotinate-nucleotide adenylyltransferase [Lachnospiraceae bacterium]
MKRTGILGGTFNPIHTGHLILAEQARSEYSLDEVLIIPSGISYFKKGTDIPDGKIRLKMCELAVKDNPGFTVSDIEIKREGNTYTADTIRELREKTPDDQLFFITGADILHEIGSWKEPKVIFDNCTLLVSVRNNESEDDLRTDMDMLKERYGARISILHTTNIDISSSMIRKLISEKKSVRYYLPEALREFILENKIYE